MNEAAMQTLHVDLGNVVTVFLAIIINAAAAQCGPSITVSVPLAPHVATK
jgi:hypothetical protein